MDALPEVLRFAISKACSTGMKLSWTVWKNADYTGIKLFWKPEESTNGRRPDDPASRSTALTHRNRKKPSPSIQRIGMPAGVSLFLAARKRGEITLGLGVETLSLPFYLMPAPPSLPLRMYVLGLLLLETGTQSLNCLSALELSLSSREKHQV